VAGVGELVWVLKLFVVVNWWWTGGKLVGNC